MSQRTDQGAAEGGPSPLGDSAAPITHTIYRHAPETIPGATSVRHAVRAVAGTASRLLMIRSGVNRDYKFPGGGVDAGETHADALRREIMEECGLALTEIGRKIAEVTEHGLSIHDPNEGFQMVSHYYLCSVDETERFAQCLEAYEERLQFAPVWISLDDALRNNRSLLDGSADLPRWTQRETWVLAALREALA
ncbi:MAG: NUDIX domain-containing protein [Spirochaetota bacterium]